MKTASRTAQAPAYRVTCALLQLTSSRPPGANNSSPVLHFYRGDVLPGWVEEPEVERLRSLGAIEPI